ncbi:S8 family serine peptidase [Streptomyces mayonensis]|uniref:S8 family serine peptidase n=1 Tax=Streptomyces mayonensis TaxID=2750816 RepID=UPI001C1E8A1E|nr:S8 family serine peptidase [Streptomyces sp. A108]MBU6536271.1 S8 family serine peptidase [Streptomyces sp. A108]
MRCRCTSLVLLALGVAVVLPTTGGRSFAAPAAPAASDAPAQAPEGSAAGDPGTTLLPPLPVRLGEDNPCTGASRQTATGTAWSQTALGLSRAQRVSRGGGVTVAVVDTGVDTGVPSLSGRVTAVGGADEDCVGHGTFAAGLVAAAPQKGSGITGIAPQAKILALAGTDDRGVPSAERVADGIRTAADRGAQVIYVGHALRTGKAEITAAVAHATRRDALVVAPAAPDAVPREDRGPDGEPPEGPYWPAAAPGALAVVDFGPNGVRQKNAPPAHEPGLSAPGSAMVSVGPQGSGHYIGSGASLAAAEVAGAAALVRAYRPGLSVPEVTGRLLDSAYPSDTPRLDPYAALSLVQDRGQARGQRKEGEEGEAQAQGQAAVRDSVPAQLPPPADPGPRTRSLTLAAVGLTAVLLLAAMAAVVPRGRARNWRPPGRRSGDASTEG